MISQAQALPEEAKEISLLSEEIKYKNEAELRLLIMTICLSTAFSGMTVVNLSAVPKEYLAFSYGEKINDDVFYGLLQGSVPAGAIIGAGISSTVMRLFTRKQFLLNINLLALIVEGVLQIPNIWVLLFSRILMGVFIGHYLAIVPIYINDLSPRQIVGSFGVYTNLFVVVAIVLSFALQVIFEQAIGVAAEPFWRILWAFPGLALIIQSILLVTGFVPESPNSLIIKGKHEEAKVVVAKFHKSEFVDEVMKLREEQVELELRRGKQQPEEEGTIKISKWAYLVAFEIPLLQQFVGLGSVIAQVGNIIQDYSHTLSLYLPLMVNAVQLIGNYSAVFVLRSTGRRTLTLLGNGTIGILDLIIAVLFLFIGDYPDVIFGVTAALLIYMVLFGMTLGPVTWLYVPEVIPASVVPYATMNNWIAATIVYTITPIVVSSAGPAVLFFIFTALTAICFIINFFFMAETKGLTRQQIAKQFFKKSKKDQA